ncbi:MAG: hypothetical protein DRP74_00700 [Candidatus Omnitrophota bacterium]|nr:MAG: hypothetical protein DRP74_00700 [Candidatus Omnitrophota bacterium]
MKKLEFIGLITVLLLNIASICNARYMGYSPDIYYWMRDVDANDHELFNVERIRGKDELNLVANAYYDEASGNWYRIDESKGAWRVRLVVDSDLIIQAVSSGSDAITWLDKLRLTDTKKLMTVFVTRIDTYSQTAEPDIGSDTVALWEDTDDNRWWLIWDKGGT